jgi:precorrin-3B synthase
VRIPLPGGMITPARLAALAGISAELGSGTLELTTHGDLQLPGISDATAIAPLPTQTGQLPSIVASPLSGRVGGNADVRPWVGELDAAICAEPRLVELGERFWFSLDDGSADVSGLGADVGVHVFEDGCALLLTGRDTGIRLAAEDVIKTLVAIALKSVPGVELSATTFPPRTKPPVGWINQDDGRFALGAAVPLGVLSARVAEFLAAIEAPLVITPWRSILVCDLDEGVADVALRVLAPLGLIFDENDSNL